MEIRLLIISLAVITFISKGVFAQQLNVKDKSFIVGLFSDYGGYQYWSDHPVKKYEIGFLGSPESLGRIAFCKYVNSKKLESFFELSEDSSIRSEKFLEENLDLFNFKTGFYVWDEYDKDEEYHLLLGKIKCSTAKKEFNALNYVLGSYIVNHDNLEQNPYLFSFANSVYKWKLVKMFLKDLGCKKIKVEQLNSIPYSIKIYFEPSVLLRSELVKLKDEGWLGEYKLTF